MVIFIKRRRGLTSKENNHYRVDEKGRLYVGGIYAGFEDDSFKLFHPSSLQRKSHLNFMISMTRYIHIIIMFSPERLFFISLPF